VIPAISLESFFAVAKFLRSSAGLPSIWTSIGAAIPKLSTWVTMSAGAK
jgi:hypothetical protein